MIPANKRVMASEEFECDDHDFYKGSGRFKLYSRENLEEGIPDVIHISRYRRFLDRCREQNPAISLELGVLGGVPHLAGTRNSIAQIIGRVRVLGSISATVEYYSPYITEDQIKEALRYAQTVLEMAGDPYQTHD